MGFLRPFKELLMETDDPLKVIDELHHALSFSLHEQGVNGAEVAHLISPSWGMDSFS